ncbi:hypothetical protein LSH36_632g00014 [Paralvinella palmiformis]|uniref:Secreted protein n=1 Tax=Paralvinella palmiformis TaxID=53620 RepID=A0AAD9J4R1_9ANNE|nr:hypothetical protein LSH36_632g00014 [Paralvinella palmiformis]
MLFVLLLLCVPILVFVLCRWLPCLTHFVEVLVMKISTYLTEYCLNSVHMMKGRDHCLHDSRGGNSGFPPPHPNLLVNASIVFDNKYITFSDIFLRRQLQNQYC